MLYVSTYSLLTLERCFIFHNLIFNVLFATPTPEYQFKRLKCNIKTSLITGETASLIYNHRLIYMNTRQTKYPFFR